MKFFLVSLFLALVALTSAAPQKEPKDLKQTSFSKNTYKYDGNVEFDLNASVKSNVEGLARYAQEFLKLFGFNAEYKGTGGSQASAQGKYQVAGEGGNVNPGTPQQNIPVQTRPVLPEARKAS